MIKLNTVYSIDNGANSVAFTEGKKGSITGTHKDGSMTGFLEGNVFTGTFHNTKVNATGLIEITFHESGFDAKWKNGMEPGPMRGKWVGEIADENSNSSNSSQNDSNYKDNQSVLFQLEINSIEEYGINYGTFYVELNVENNLLNDFRNDCNYDSIVALISSTLDMNVSEILNCADSEINLDELKLDDYDWWSYSPCIKVLKIDELDLFPIYRVRNGDEEYNSDAAEILKKEEDEISDYASDFVTDTAFHFDQVTFLDAI